jgi:hypothetical protein
MLNGLKNNESGHFIVLKTKLVTLFRRKQRYPFFETTRSVLSVSSSLFFTLEKTTLTRLTPIQVQVPRGTLDGRLFFVITNHKTIKLPGVTARDYLVAENDDYAGPPLDTFITWEFQSNR